MDILPGNGIIYCRVSSSDQVKGTSLDVQEAGSVQFAASSQIEVMKVFVEKGESAKTADRTEFQKALLFATDKKNKINYFIVHKLDRFARNQEDHMVTRTLLKRAGVQLLSATEYIDNTPVGKLTEGMLSAIAEFDNNQRAERSKCGMMKRVVEEGVWMWSALGYYRPNSKANIQPDPVIAPLIKLIFEEYSTGNHTYRSLANFMASKGLKTKTGKVPKAQMMEKILKNPIYYGFMNIWGGHMGKFEPIISKELFDKCQPGRKSPHANARSANNPLFPLRKLVICSTCQQPLTGSSSRGRHGVKYPYYHHHRQGCPNSQAIPKKELEQKFVGLLQDITPDKKYEKLFKAIVVDTWRNNYKKLDAENAIIRKEIANLEKERQQVFDQHLRGVYSDEEFVEQKEMINTRINQKRLMVQDKLVEEFDMEEALAYCFEFVRNTAKTWIDLENDYAARLRFQKRILSGNLEFDGKKFGTAELSPIYRMNKELSETKKTSDGKSSLLAAPRGIEPRLHG
jgi:site-specific DNA recombinase